MTKQEYKSAADEIRIIREIAYGEGYQAGQQAMRKRAADVTELWDRMPVKVQDGFFEQFDNPRDIFEQGQIEACTSVQYGILALSIEEPK